MTKYEWDRRFKRLLKDLPRDEQRRVFEYYDELFEDKIDAGLKEAEIVAQFGEPEVAAEKILGDYSQYLSRAKIAADEIKEEEKTLGAEESQYDRPIRAQRGFALNSDTGASQSGETDDAGRPKKKAFFGSADGEFDNPDRGSESAEITDGGYQTADKAFERADAVFAEADAGGAAANKCAEDDKKKVIQDYSYYGTNFDVLTENSNSGFAFVRRLKLDLAETDVVIRKAEKFSLRFQEDKNTKYEINTSRDTLYVKEKYKRYLHFFNFKSRPKTMIIELPSLSEIAFNSVKCGCDVQGFSLRHVVLKTVNGDLILKDCGSEYLSLSTTNGDASITGGDYGGFTVTTTSGDIKADGIRAKDAACISTSGDIILGNVKTDGKKLLVKTISGDIKCDSIVLNGGEFKTISGDVDVRLKGREDDFNVKISTITGNVKAPRGGSGSSQVTVSTISGNVDLAFV